MTEGFFSPNENFGPVEEAAVPYHPGPGPESSGVDQARGRNERHLLSINGVKGIGIGRNAIGDDAIVVFVVDGSVRARLPADVDGYPVETVVTGEIDAYRSDAP